MKTKGTKSFRMSRLGAVAAVAFALVATTVPSAFSAGEVFGKSCTTEGVSTGTSSTSLICAEGANGKLSWQRVRIGSSKANPVSASRANPGTIEFHHYLNDAVGVKEMQKIIDQFQDINPGVKINQVVYNSTDFTNLGFTRINNNPKAALVVLLRGGQFNQFYAGGLLADLSNQRFMKQNVVASALQPGIVDGKVFGLPYFSLFNNPLYNVELFEKNGFTVPTTWSQTLAFCKKVKAAGFIPFAWPGASIGNAGQILNSFLANSAPDLATLTKRISDIDTGKADLTTPWFTAMAAQYKEMFDAGCFPPNVVAYTDVAAQADFAFGKAAVYPTGSFSMGGIKSLNPAMTGKMRMMSLITVDTKPLYEGITNNTAILVVNKKSSGRDQSIAKAFMSYLAQPAVAQQYALATSNHLSIINVDYSSNIDLLNVSPIMGKRLLLAPRFLFNNIGTVRTPMEEALMAIGSGAEIKKTLEEASKKIKQGLGA